MNQEPSCKMSEKDELKGLKTYTIFIYNYNSYLFHTMTSNAFIFCTFVDLLVKHFIQIQISVRRRMHMKLLLCRYQHVNVETSCFTLAVRPSIVSARHFFCWAFGLVFNSNSAGITVRICSSVCVCVNILELEVLCEACTSLEGDSFSLQNNFLPLEATKQSDRYCECSPKE